MKRLLISYMFRSSRKQKYVDALTHSAKQLGYKVIPVSGIPLDATDDDILVLWNRHARQDSMARKIEAVGGKVLTFENPYVKVCNEDRYISVGLGWHNNKRFAPVQLDNGERWQSFNVPIKPWREEGNYVLIATQAKTYNACGLGHESYRQPEGWDLKVCQMIRSFSNRDILFRQHPHGKISDYKPLQKELKAVRISDGTYPISDDLEKAFCTVVHTSNSATESLLKGVPVFYTGDSLFLQEACSRNLQNIESPNLSDKREELFNRMAWAQYSVDEILSGYFFDVMLNQNKP